jgi:hypothetical protein
MSPVGNRALLLRPSAFLALFGLILFSFLFLSGCSSDGSNSKESLTSGTTTGFGNSTGPVANLLISIGSNPIGNGATTTVTVLLTDSQGRKTDGTVILTSNGGGNFSALGGTTSASTITAGTTGGSLVVTYTPSAAGQFEIAASVVGSNIRGAAILTVL